ncbi:MAG: methyltransferase domain-containing protein [Acidobacteriota bacterium]
MIGGKVGVDLLNRFSRNGTVSAFPDVATAYASQSKLERLFGPAIWNEFQNKDVLDFGSGRGGEAVQIAERGARRVVGLELYKKWITSGTELAACRGVAGKCFFGREWAEPVDVIISIDSFEHFADPGAILKQMDRLLKPAGCILASFGPTWYHPLGGHIFSVFPYAHLLFTESALVRWRSLYKTDGARSIAECGLNRMTIRRFEELIARSPFRFATFEAVPIRRLRPLANRLTREFTTAVVRCKLVRRTDPEN